MDPDRGTIFYLISVLLLSFVLLLRSLRLLCAIDRNEEDAGIGYSDTAAGLYVLLGIQSIALVACASLLLQRAAWWMILIALMVLLVGLLCVLSFGFAFAEGCVLNGPEQRVLSLIGRVFTAVPKLLFRTLRLSAAAPVTEEDILDLVDDVQEDDLIDENQKEMISAVFELDDIEVSEIMTHRTEMEAVEDCAPAAEVIALALDKGFSRLPVYHKNLDDIVGILHVKDLLRLVENPAEKSLPITGAMRSAMFVPESCHARELLVDFKARHTQIAIVVDEYGGTAGIVSMEDILEEIVGNIQDEFDQEEDEMRPVEGGVITDGSTDLDDIFERFDIEPPLRGEDEDFDSVGGMILQQIGRFPAEGEKVSVSYGGLLFTVLESGERKIDRVLCKTMPATED